MKAASLKEPRSDSSANFIAVRDSRNRKLRGLWMFGLKGDPVLVPVPKLARDEAVGRRCGRFRWG